jgi:S1-C subfamily serine protease
VRSALLLILVLCAACGGDELPPIHSPGSQPAAPAQDEGRPPAGTLWRHEVDAVVDAGLGRFLAFFYQRAELEPRLDEEERFLGWEIVRRYPSEFWDLVDLQEGDVITAVNGKPLERETQAYDAFASLKQAPQLVVEILRGGQRMELVFKIKIQPGHAPAPSASASPGQP